MQDHQKKLFNRHIARALNHLETANVDPKTRQAVKNEFWYLFNDLVSVQASNVNKGVDDNGGRPNDPASNSYEQETSPIKN
jgi:hypothetical protein